MLYEEESLKELEEKVWVPFSEAIFLEDLACKLGAEIVDVWENRLIWKKEGLISFL